MYICCTLLRSFILFLRLASHLRATRISLPKQGLAFQAWPRPRSLCLERAQGVVARRNQRDEERERERRDTGEQPVESRDNAY